MLGPIVIINQVFEIQSKLRDSNNLPAFERNFNRLFSAFTDEGYLIRDPTGEAYHETRTDCEVSISGNIGGKKKITRTIKPIIYQKKEGNILLLQKAVVIAE